MPYYVNIKYILNAKMLMIYRNILGEKKNKQLPYKK